MQIKNLTNLSIATAIGSLSCAQPPQPYTPEWKATLRVADETGQPVPAARVWVSYMLTNQLTGLTDTNGIFAASHRDNSYALAFHVEKSGYYPFRTRHEMGAPPQHDVSKSAPTLQITLKHVAHPIPMFARRAQIEIPALDKPIGFDLTAYDWVAPYGKGNQSDLVFELQRRWANRRDFECNLKITFPNQGDGVALSSRPTSQYTTGPRIPTSAPLDGYTPDLSRHLDSTPAGASSEENKQLNYYLRVRTALDAQGNVTSALYGKIYGTFDLDPINSKTTWILFTYYLNPTPNSRNVEFDPNRNLFQNLSPTEQVNDP